MGKIIEEWNCEECGLLTNRFIWCCSGIEVLNDEEALALGFGPEEIARILGESNGQRP